MYTTIYYTKQNFEVHTIHQSSSLAGCVPRRRRLLQGLTPPNLPNPRNHQGASLQPCSGVVSWSKCWKTGRDMRNSGRIGLFLKNSKKVNIKTSCLENHNNGGGNMNGTSTVDQTIEEAEKVTKQHIKSVSEAVKNVHSSGTKSLHAAIKLGVALLEARQALGANFYEILKSVIHRKKMQRYIRMVTHKDCDEQLAKAPHLNDKTNLKADTRITALTDSDFSWSIPSMGKLTSMRWLSDEDFTKVMEGDYDPLEKSIKERDKLTPTGKEKVKIEEKFKKILKDPKSATSLVYEESKTALLNQLYDATKVVQDMEKERDPLEQRILELEGELEDAKAEIDRLTSSQEAVEQTLRETKIFRKKKAS